MKSYLLGPNKYLVEFLVQNKPGIASIFHGFISPCTHLRELPRYKNDN